MATPALRASSSRRGFGAPHLRAGDRPRRSGDTRAPHRASDAAAPELIAALPAFLTRRRCCRAVPVNLDARVAIATLRGGSKQRREVAWLQGAAAHTTWVADRRRQIALGPVLRQEARHGREGIMQDPWCSSYRSTRPRDAALRRRTCRMRARCALAPGRGGATPSARRGRLGLVVGGRPLERACVARQLDRERRAASAVARDRRRAAVSFGGNRGPA